MARKAVRVGLWTVGAAAVAAGAGLALTRGDVAGMDDASKFPLARLPLSFERNLGQTDERVDFVARGAGTTVWVAGAETVFAFADGKEALDVLRMSFVGAKDPTAEGRGELEAKSNYLRAENSVKNAPHFAEAVEKDLYPGVDLRWHGSRTKLEYDVLVAAGADASAVRIALKGADEVTVRPNGDLAVRMGDKELIQSAPVAYQMKGDVREPVAAAFDVRGGEIGFRLGAYDRSRELVIDPSIDFSTYLGGAGEETGNGVAVSAGAAYVVGGTTSIDFPLGYGHIPSAPKGLTDAYVLKLDASGTFVRWASYLAGRDYDEAFGVAYDSANSRVWVVGQTFSNNFPTMTPTQGANAGTWDAFVTQLDSTGDTMLFSTYLGGADDDFGRGITVGGVVSVTGFTKSPNFPTVLPTQGAFGGAWDAFLSSWSRTTPAAGLTQSTYLGGAGDDRGYAIASFAGQLVSGAPGTVEMITNGSFEAGGGSFSSWTTADVTPDGGTPPFEPLTVRTNGYTFASPSAPWPYPGDATYPFFSTSATDGTKAAVTGFGMGSNPGVITLYQDVAVPPTSDDGLISFDWRAGWHFFGTQDRRFEVDVLPDLVTPTNVYTVNFPRGVVGAPVTINFDDLPSGPLVGPYGGAIWNVGDWSVVGSSSASPPHSAEANDVQNVFTFASPVVFDGASVAASFIIASHQWDMYLGGVKVAETASQFVGSSFQFVPSGYAGPVDEVRLVQSNQARIDNVVYRPITNLGTRDTGNISVALPFDLTDHAGKTIRLRFKLTVPETDTGPAQFQLDKVGFLAAKGHIAVAGRTTTTNFLHKNTYNTIDHTVQDVFGGAADAFATCYTRSGRKVRWSTTLGGSADDEARGVSIISGGDVALCGRTESFNFPRVMAHQPNRRGPSDAWVAKILNGHETMDFCTYLGGTASEQANGVVLSEAGDVYVVGTTDSGNFPVTPDALQDPLVAGMNPDAFVARYGTVVNVFSVAQGGLLKYSTAFGGDDADLGNAIAVPSGSTTYIAGTTRSGGAFPLVGPADFQRDGSTDAFVAKVTVSSVQFPAGDLTVAARSPDTLALSWVPQAPEANALVVQRTGTDGVTNDIAVLSPYASQFVDTGLAPNTNYAYSVVARHDDGSKSESSFVAATTLPYPPTSPAGLAAAVSGARVLLTWTDASDDETGFEVQRSSGGAFATVSVVKSGKTSFETTQIASGDVTSAWRVVAVNRGGASAPSNEVSSTTTSTLRLRVLSGALVDAKGAGADKFSASGSIEGLAFDPNAQPLRIEFGTADKPVVLSVPAASRGWTSKKGVLTFSSVKAYLGGARFKLVLDAKKGTFSLTASGFDLGAVQSRVSLGMALGDDAGASETLWTQSGPGKLVLM
jgi:hypothetical protein